jgi:hypothetical protein
MPWYKSGTVACTLNSTTVTGTGTAFAANARVGDAYLGPDGRWYEVANIASDTVLSILPAYLGATVAAGIYALAPMQGYTKESADTLRALVNQYGAQLAALGTTGNYDILPVNKGGTGGTDQAGARTGLGLGAVSTENIVPVVKGGTGGNSQATARTGLGLGSSATATLVSSLTDSTPGRVLVAGYAGVGSFDNAAFSGLNQTPSSYRVGGTFAGQFVNPQFGTMSGSLRVDAGPDSQSAVQTFVNWGNGQLFTRAQTGGTWGVWRMVYDTSNTTRAADGTLKAI